MKCVMCKHEMSKSCFEKPTGGFYKTCITCREYSKKYSKWYSETYPEKRAAARKIYKRSEQGKAINKKYRHTQKGKATAKRAKRKYRASENGCQAEREYRSSIQKEYKQKYAQIWDGIMSIFMMCGGFVNTAILRQGVFSPMMGQLF